MLSCVNADVGVPPTQWLNETGAELSCQSWHFTCFHSIRWLIKTKHWSENSSLGGQELFMLIPFTIKENAGFIGYTAASHQGAFMTFGLYFWRHLCSQSLWHRSKNKWVALFLFDIPSFKWCKLGKNLSDNTDKGLIRVWRLSEA